MAETSKPERELKLELPMVPEYGYEEGLSKIVGILLDLLKKNINPVVAFSAPGRDVGKSTLAMDIGKKLLEQGFPAFIAHEANEINISSWAREFWGSKPWVFIIDQAQWNSVDVGDYQKIKKFHDEEVKAECRKNNFNVSGVNLWVGICSPNQPFAKTMVSGQEGWPIADIIINNTKAVKK